MSNANGSNQAERSGIVCVLWRVVKLEVEDSRFSPVCLSRTVTEKGRRLKRRNRTTIKIESVNCLPGVKQWRNDYGRRSVKRIAMWSAWSLILSCSDITNTCVLPLLLCKQEKNGLIWIQLLISQHTQAAHTNLPTTRTGSRAYIIWAAFSLRRPISSHTLSYFPCLHLHPILL